MKLRTLFLVLVSVLTCISMQAQKQIGQAMVPPMGWNSWNYFGKKDINEQVIKECMDAMVANGLVEAGYNYFIIDGGWRGTTLNEDGTLKVNVKKFPNGMKPLVDYAHSLGMKFGLHTVPGSHDCAGDPVGAYGIEEIHIRQFIDWGVDFLKVDRCQLKIDCDGPCWTEEEVEAVYRKWQTLLEKEANNILFSVSAYKYRTWMPEVCHLSRTTGDISCRITGGAFFSEEERGKQYPAFFSVLEIAHTNNKWAEYAGPGYWNDPDMLITGDHGLTHEEQKTHFALWSVMSSPMFLGNDPRNMTADEKALVLNKKAIEINQDPTEQGVFIEEVDGVEYWKKELSDGSCAIVVLNNKLKEDRTASYNLKKIVGKKVKSIYDVYEGKTLDVKAKDEFTLAPHACRFFLVNDK